MRPRGFDAEGRLHWIPPIVFRDAALAAKGKATTGFPWMLLGADSWAVLRGWWMSLFVGACVARVVVLFCLVCSVTDWTVWDIPAEDAVSRGFRDWVRSFIKDEPHNELKVLSGRLRLIFNTGATDIAVWRWLFGPLMRHVVLHNETSPFKPGMGLHDEGLRALERWFTSLSPDYKGLVGTDVSGWDWSTLLPLARLAWRVCCRVQELPEDSDLARLQWVVILLHFRKVVLFGDNLFA